MNKMIYAIIFFVILFLSFAIYYHQFMISKLWATKYKRVEVIHEVIKAYVYPYEFTHDFVIGEFYLEKIKLNEKDIIRDYAAKLVSDSVYDMIKKDINNEMFLITEEGKYNYDPFNRRRYFKIEVRLLPVLKETKPYFNNKHSQVKIV